MKLEFMKGKGNDPNPGDAPKDFITAKKKPVQIYGSTFTTNLKNTNGKIARCDINDKVVCSSLAQIERE